MRLLEFKAKEAYGHININIIFEKNPLIVIAPNGSGKTTALKLMQALLSPSLSQLLAVEFIETSIRFDDGGKEKFILAKKHKGIFTISVSGLDATLSIPTSFLEEVEAELPPQRKALEAERALRLKYADHPVYLLIAEINKPVFLGLDRKGQVNESELAGYDITAIQRSGQYRTAISNSTGISLLESRRLIQSAYRRIRRIRDYKTEKLRNELLFNGFEYHSLENGTAKQALDFSEYFEEKNLEKQRLDVLAALDSIGVDSHNAEKEINNFFSNIKDLARRLSKRDRKDEMMTMFEAVINKAALVRLKKLIEKVKDSNNQTLGLSKKFESFVKCMNVFFADSNKEISIDSVGTLKFSRNGKLDVPIEALSSGEKHLVVMFSHLFFNSFGDKSNIFIIDEPEISLHLRWQDLLLQKMIESSPRAQIIVATHSPEIVGEYSSHCVDISYA